tara:strand:+ start:315 stop:872 length:558 start_codon:yes stop_codon:yes gene_type:complete
MKNCNRHGKKYKFDNTTTLCAHPDCIKRLCLSFGPKSAAIQKMLTIVQEHHSFDDFTDYTVERLLLERKENKPVVINKTWLWFTLNRFIRDEMIQIAIEDELQDDWESKLESYTGWYKRHTPSAEGFYLGMDLIALISEEFGQSYALYYLGGLTKTDVLKAEGMTPTQLLQKLKVIQEWISINYI